MSGCHTSPRERRPTQEKIIWVADLQDRDLESKMNAKKRAREQENNDGKGGHERARALDFRCF